MNKTWNINIPVLKFMKWLKYKTGKELIIYRFVYNLRYCKVVFIKNLLKTHRTDEMLMCV